jgi:hypothetical protein
MKEVAGRFRFRLPRSWGLERRLLGLEYRERVLSVTGEVGYWPNRHTSNCGVVEGTLRVHVALFSSIAERGRNGVI